MPAALRRRRAALQPSTPHARGRAARAVSAALLLASCTGCGQRETGAAALTGSAAPPPASAAAGSTSAAAGTEVADAALRAGAPDAALRAAVPAASGAGQRVPPCPEGMAHVGGFCIDRYEAHLMADVGGALTSHPHYQRLASGVRYVARSEPGVFPQAYISRVEAKAACEAAGKRLCSRKEWKRACRGQGTQRYPYGPDGERGRCNTGKIHLLRRFFGANPPGGWNYEEHFNNPELDKLPGFLARTGEYAGCVSELGVHDMLGNLHEWVSDMVDPSLVDELDAEGVERNRQPWREGNGVFMGGFFSTTSELGPGCYYVTIAHEPKYHDYSTGFRCCASPASQGAQKRGGDEGGDRR